MSTKASRAKKFGRIIGNRPQGHGGARGNGAHLSSKAKDTSEQSRRDESKIKRGIATVE
jgi:hypothetical protein